MKVLVTGDRHFNDVECVIRELAKLPSGSIIIHGACKGADTLADTVGEAMGLSRRPYPALWDKHKKGAGPIRNQQMLDEEHLPHEPIELCIAFHNDIENSKGTKDMMKRAMKANIECRLVTSEGL